MMPALSVRRFLWLALPVAVLAGSLTALPLGIQKAAEHWLTQQGMQAQIADIDLNLFTATASISDARSINADGRGFQVGRLLFSWRYLPLFEKRLHLTTLVVDGLHIDVTRMATSENPLEVAGLSLKQSSSNEQQDNPWGFGLDSAKIEASTLTYSDPLLNQSISLQASSVSNLASWSDTQPISIITRAGMAGGELQLQGQIQPFGEHIKATLRIQAEGLPLATAAPVIPDDARLDGLLHADLGLILDYSATSGIDLQISGDSRLRTYHFGLANPPLDMGGDLTHWQGLIKIIKAPDAALQLSGTGKLAASEMRITDRKHLADLLYLSSIDIPDLQISSLQDIRATAVKLGNGHALVYPKPDKETQQALLSWQGIDSTQSTLLGPAVGIDSLAIQGFNAHIERNAQGQWNVQQAVERSLPPEAPTTAATATTTQEQPAMPVAVGDPLPPDAAKPPQPLRIGQISLGQDSHVTIRDATVKPALDMRLHELQIQLGQLDNQQPQTPSPLQLTSRVGDYGELSLDGDISPFASPAAAALKGKISGIDTVPLSGFARKLVGHRIRQGTVSGDLEINIVNGKLDSSVDLILNKLQIAALKGVTANEFEKSSGMPLNSALNLLRDRDENIRLKLPITGDADKPDIKINDIIRQAVFKAVQTAVLTFYSPLGVINATDKLLSLIHI